MINGGIGVGGVGVGVGAGDGVANGGGGGGGGGFQPSSMQPDEVGSTETLDGRKKKQSMYVKNKLNKGSR